MSVPKTSLLNNPSSALRGRSWIVLRSAVFSCIIVTCEVKAVDDSELRSEVLRCLPTPPTSGAIHTTFTLARRLPGELISAYQGDTAEQQKADYDFKTELETWVDGQQFWYSVGVVGFNQGRDPKTGKQVGWGTFQKCHVLTKQPGSADHLRTACDANAMALSFVSSVPLVYLELLGFPQFEVERKKIAPGQLVRDLVTLGTVNFDVNGDRITFEQFVMKNNLERTHRVVFRKRDNVYQCDLYEELIENLQFPNNSRLERSAFTYDTVLSNQECGKVPVTCLSESLTQVDGKFLVDAFRSYQLVSYSIEKSIPTKLLNPSIGRNVEVDDLCKQPAPPSASSWGFYWWVILIVSISLVVVGVWRMQKLNRL